MKTHDAVLIPGDGIGPEVTAAVVRILDAAGAKIRWTTRQAGLVALEQEQSVLPESTLGAIREQKLALKGPCTTPVGTGFQSVNVQLRKAFNLYAAVRPVRSLPGVKTRFENVDLVIVRENTEDLYSGLEHQVAPGVVESLKVITASASQRIARFAFEYARKYGRRKVTAVHKANIMKLTDGLFLQCTRTISRDFPDVEYEEKIVDNACMQLVMRPEQFDILLLPNLYGDIVSDIAAGLVGGLGVVPGANIGERVAVFEAVHGSAPDIAGQNKANPTALLLSALMMLRHLGEGAAADAIFGALTRVFAAGTALTADLGGSASTTAFTDAVIRELDRAQA